MAASVDHVTLALLILSGLILLLVSGLILVFCVRYRADSPVPRKPARDHLSLEWSWTFATFLAFLGLFAWGAWIYLRMHEVPPGSMEISVVAKQWMWKFQHPTGQREINDLHIPIGRPILLTMTSEDVIHSLFVPAFRFKQDVLPGRYLHGWFEATKPGTYHLFCTQYCGVQHAEMRGSVTAMSPDDYQRWLEDGLPPVRLSGGTTAEQGAKLFQHLGCIACHGAGGNVRAPELSAVYGSRVELSDGRSVFADENYLRESILNPRAKIVRGFDDLMPSYAGIASEGDVLNLIAYLKSLRGSR